MPQKAVQKLYVFKCKYPKNSDKHSLAVVLIQYIYQESAI